MDCDDESVGAHQYLGSIYTGNTGTLDARSVLQCRECGLDDYRYDIRSDDDTGPFVFLWRYGRAEEYHFHHSAEFHCHGCDQCDLGCHRVQSGFWR